MIGCISEQDRNRHNSKLFYFDINNTDIIYNNYNKQKIKKK